MENNKSTKKSETIIALGAGFGSAFGAAFGAIFESIDMGLAISIGIALGVTKALVFGQKIVQLFNNPEKTDSDKEKK